MDAKPLLDLTESGATLEHEFYLVRGVSRLPDGEIVVANGGSNEIRFFSSTGTFLHAFGGDGEGPGEFGWLRSVFRYRGDSLLAFDSGLRRATVFSREGAERIVSFINSTARDVIPMESGALLMRPASTAANDYNGEDGILFRGEDPIIRFSPSGDLQDTISILAGFEERMDVGMALFGKDSHFAVFGNRVYAGDADLMEFKVLSASGSLEKIVRVPGFSLEITAEDIAREKAARLGPNPTPQQLAGFSRLPIPETKPAYSDLLVDSEGSVWTREYQHIWAERAVERSDGQPSVWTLFSPDGIWLGSVRLPPRFVAFEIGTDYVLGFCRDELDVEHVQLLRLHRD